MNVEWAFFALWAGLSFGFAAGVVVGRRPQSALENQGEAAVRRTLAREFPNDDFHLMNNLTLPDGVGGTTQIDHVLVSPVGIFVIETKHYTGWIFGDERAAQWTQTIYKRKSRFQNPIHQNFKHVKTLEKLLDGIPPDHIHSLVVFTGDAEFKTSIPRGVLPLIDLAHHVRNFTEFVISEKRMIFCVGVLELKRREMSGQTDIEHRAYLTQKFGGAGGRRHGGGW